MRQKKEKCQSPDRRKSMTSSDMLSDGVGKAARQKEKQQSQSSELAYICSLRH